MSFTEYWGGQFKNPRGLGGKISTFLMKLINTKMTNCIKSKIKNDAVVLDIGFGDGYVLSKLLKKTNSIFYGIDISQDMVKTASKKNIRAVNTARLYLKRASAENIPFDVIFDQIYTSNTVYFWNGLNETLREIYFKLKPGGEFLNIFRNKEWLNKLKYTKHGYEKYTEHELVEASNEAGFETELIKIKNGTFCLKAIKPE